MAHRLIAYDLGAERFAIVLAPAHIKSFIEKLAGDPKTRQRANAIVKATAQIAKKRHKVGTAGEQAQIFRHQSFSLRAKGRWKGYTHNDLRTS